MKPLNIAIVISRYYQEISEGLLSGAKSYLESKQIFIDHNHIYEAPGAFEIPLIAKALCERPEIDGVITLGCVIKGETAHFDFIATQAAWGIMNASLQTLKPITFGILTPFSYEQALERSRPGVKNKGCEAAQACFESLLTLHKIRAKLEA